MVGKLENKIAIVTGSTSGIGEAIACLFAAEGATVVVTGRNEERGSAVVKKIIELGGEAIFVAIDVRNLESIKNLIDQTIGKFGRIDILVNNAGTILIKPFLEITMDDWDFLMDTDGRSYVYAMRETIPHMIKNNGGVVLNVASLAALKPSVTYSLYNFVKAGVNMMSKAVAKEVAEFNVRVNVLCPGSILTPMIEGSPLNEFRKNNTPLGRLGTPEEIAAAALFLCSDDASFITGTSLVADGGSE